MLVVYSGTRAASIDGVVFFSTDMMITMPLRKGSCHDPQ